jgi:Tfp pilus assembly protein PilX
MKKGFTLFIAMIVMATLLLVSSTIAALAVRGSFIYSTARESQKAFYAADSGMECALFWDVKSPSGLSAFATSLHATITHHILWEGLISLSLRSRLHLVLCVLRLL